MKKVILFFILIIGFQGLSQNNKRLQVKGKVIVEKSDVEGIPIINKTSNAMVFTNETGEFLLNVTLNDSIEVQALQYKNIGFKVNKAVMESGLMKIYLIEETHVLDEVVVSTNNLTGNLSQDIEHARDFKPKLDVFYFGIPNEYAVMKSNTAKLNRVDLDGSHNVAMNPEHLNMINGLDIVNVVDLVLLPIFRSGEEKKNDMEIPKVRAVSTKYYFGSGFLVDNFNIPEHRVEEFVGFVQSENLDYSLLNYGNEMEFLELLNRKSKEFLAKKD